MAICLVCNYFKEVQSSEGYSGLRQLRDDIFVLLLNICLKVHLFWMVHTDVVAQAFAHFVTMWTCLLHKNIALVNRGDMQFQVVVAVC